MSQQEVPHRHHVQRRHSSTNPRRRSTDPAQRRRKEDQKNDTGFGAFLIVGIAVLFLAYVFNVQGFATASDHFFSGIDAAGKSQNARVASLTTTLLPLLGLLIGALILVGLFRWVLAGAKKSRKKRALSGRDVITLERFREIAITRGIRPRIANHAYALLLPYYNRSMRVRMDDSLRNDLHMTVPQVNDLLGNLLRSTDRKPRVGDSTEIVTVMDLLRCVQDAPRNFLQDTALHDAAKLRRISVIRPTMGRTPIPAQASNAITPIDLNSDTGRP